MSLHLPTFNNFSIERTFSTFDFHVYIVIGFYYTKNCNVVMVLCYFIISLCERNHVLFVAQTIERHREREMSMNIERIWIIEMTYKIATTHSGHWQWMENVVVKFFLTSQYTSSKTLFLKPFCVYFFLFSRILSARHWS